MKAGEQDQSPPGYGTLIKIAREAQGLSPEVAASHMPFKFSGSSWRQIEAGYRGRERKPVGTKPATLAAMARTVGLTADRLREHHPEAAAVLREMELQHAQQSPPIPEALHAAPPHVRRMIEAALEDVEPADRAELLRDLAADYEAVTRRRARTSGHPTPRRTG
ncbi:helix-turn-helix domain-containing protein [Streptomyces sp. NBC_01788]|uniref:helix-turn-helix domain-containing protein n=1 Tax=Streptomyces sp. NBC_01788 TaxID=2975940 RepID=UPI002DD9168C|nr:helix-turn-helix transcriptional regulator [Streptomyces sp. NBC_01788]WSB29653.1 helix-turn-helix domain-containing protein [Streptomyces sp. NBC_01788]